MLRNELSGVASVINQTDGRCVFRIGGTKRTRGFGEGRTHRSRSAGLQPRRYSPHAGRTYQRASLAIDPAPTYDFAVPRSFAASFCEWLIAAAAATA